MLLSRRQSRRSTVTTEMQGKLAFMLCDLSGWGRIYGGGPAANILQQAKLPLVSHEVCKQKYRTIDRRAHLCAGEGRSGASGGCNGDSGGPLVCEEGNTWYLHGAVSFGMRNCPTTHYTVFTRITSYKSWILDKIGNNVAMINKLTTR